MARSKEKEGWGIFSKHGNLLSSKYYFEVLKTKATAVRYCKEDLGESVKRVRIVWKKS